MIDIKTINFNIETPQKLRKIKNGTNWPVVYILNNQKEAYIGETTNASIRANQHLANEVRKDLNKISIITDETFNKSSILDLESFLIKYMSADNKFKLQNGNTGLKDHNYYQREMYEKKFKDIWIQLKAKGLVTRDLSTIRNTDLFKYSPYKSLTVDQYMVVNDILSVLANDVKNNSKTSFIVTGGAGTGKTILGIYLMKLLNEAINDSSFAEEDEVEEILLDVLKIKQTKTDLKIGLVIPMDNLRTTLRKCFREIKGLNSKMVLSPNDVAKSDEYFDILIVDEAHRLRRRKNLTQYGTFDKNNDKFNLGKEGTELDWILLKSKYQILFYDERQSIKPTDVRKEKFEQIMFDSKNHLYSLSAQLRCLLGGNEYIDYINSIFSNNPPKRKATFKNYDFKIFDNVNEMVENIKEKDKEYGLCRNVAGYAWQWKSKGQKLPMHLTKKDIDKMIFNNLYDIEIDGYRYIWNTKPTDWINSSNSVNEIGSIHTTQGYDLNYTGLIIGNDLRYDLNNEKFYIDRSSYKDVKGKSDTTDEDLLSYLLNIYSTMCLRGMLGTYLYVCDDGLREYFKKYIN
ncbi:MAG: DNA/RNA helicase domain-containing protein [Bacilli bacterium]